MLQRDPQRTGCYGGIMNSGADFSSVSVSASEAIMGAPFEFALLSPYPNPFNPTTAISYQLQAASYVELTIYDIQGQEVAVLVDGFLLPGVYDATFDGAGLSSGVYFAVLQAGNFNQTRKLILIK